MNYKIVKIRWKITKMLLRLAQFTSVKDSDYGTKLDEALTNWLYYIDHGNYPGGL